jgi:hypothetical protein
METVLPILMGVSLAACAGLRAFLPLLAAGLAVRFGWWPVQDWYRWAGSNEALITFGVATVLEILADKVPGLDHVLDVLHTVARPVAGALVAMGAFSQVSPSYAVALGIIIGAPLAAGFHVTKAGTRAVSTATTAGIANPVLSLAEDFAALFGVGLALVAPVLSVVLLIGIGIMIYQIVRWRRRKAENRAV